MKRKSTTIDSTTPPLKKPRLRNSPDLPSPPASAPSPDGRRRRTPLSAAHQRQPQANQEEGPKDLRTPQFWDNLGRIPLVKAALAELDRRNRQSATEAPKERVAQERFDGDIQRYARHGGPDLSDIRGDMPRSSQGTRGQGTRGRGTRARGRGHRGVVQKPQNTRRATGSSRGASTHTKSSRGPYDAGFKQQLINYNVWPINHYLETGRRPPPPENFQAIAAFINGGRTSLGPEVFDEGHFTAFQKAYHLATSEDPRSRTLEKVEGGLSGDSRHVRRGPVKLVNLQPLLPENFVPGNPDRIYGSRPEKLGPPLRTAAELPTLILPTAQQDIACPNMVVHIKGPGGSAETCDIQAAYDGALAARGMEALSLFGRDTRGQPDPIPHIARTLTCTFAAGQLRIYAVHLGGYISRSAGAMDFRNVQYTTSFVGAWFMDTTLEDFRKGAAAFRNAIEWARLQREEAISQANRRASEVSSPAASGDGGSAA